MKKTLYFVFAIAFINSACNNQASDKPKTVRTKADTLYEEVMDGHDAGMGKMGALTKAQQEASRLIDSISKLPAKAREMAAPYKTRLDGLLTDLKTADSSMNQWMEQLNLDSAMNNTERRVDYLVSQKEKVTVVKEAIINSLQKADSVLKKNF